MLLAPKQLQTQYLMNVTSSVLDGSKPFDAIDEAVAAVADLTEIQNFKQKVLLTLLMCVLIINIDKTTKTKRTRKWWVCYGRRT